MGPLEDVAQIIVTASSSKLLGQNGIFFGNNIMGHIRIKNFSVPVKSVSLRHAMVVDDGRDSNLIELPVHYLYSRKCTELFQSQQILSGS